MTATNYVLVSALRSHLAERITTELLSDDQASYQDASDWKYQGFLKKELGVEQNL